MTIIAEKLFKRAANAIAVAGTYGQIDGEHHKQWVINEMVRQLLGNDPQFYAEWVAGNRAGEDGPDTYGWEEGIPP